MAEVTLRGLKKSFGKTEVIKGIDLDIADGEFVVFVGPSGCGKSTLLRMIAGLEDITEGELRIGGRVCNDDPPKRRGAAMVFQSYALYPHKTVRGNIAFGLRIAGVPKAEIRTRIATAAETLEIAHLLDRKPSQLSGGQRQRVAIGRAIVRDPEVFLFDEPLSNLDAALRVNMRMEIARLHSRLGATMAYVTHDQVEAMTLADRIVVLDGGLARQIGSPMELYENPVDTFVAGFIGSPRMNFLPATAATMAGGGSGLTLSILDGTPIHLPSRSGLAEGTSVTLGVRPEDLLPKPGADAEGPRIEGTIDVVERFGSQTHFGVRLAGGSTVVAIGPGQIPARVGEPIALGIAMEKLHLFDAKGLSLRPVRAA